MKCKQYLLTFILFFAYVTTYSQSAKVAMAAEPSWVSKNTIDYSNTSLDKNAEDGYIDFAVETQISLADQSEYYRFSKKIISQAGVQNGSEISVPFDPGYDHLTFHVIKIIRNGETLNKLQLSNIKTLHQEKELTRFIYNGKYNAVLILDDVRKGDIIEYSYTIKGFNPIFKNRYANSLGTQYSVPVYNLYYKLLVPAGRKINIKNMHEDLQPIISSVNGQQIYEWHKNNVPPLHQQDYKPSWYNPYGEILLSEYNSWKEVNDWAMELFPIKKDLSAAVQKKIKDIQSASANNNEKIKVALRFVQDDIRYMGIEMGENSHKPADPSKVFNQRFGDCKEKTYLLCCMLRAMNIEANPVLINTESKRNTNNFLPAPIDFDHATVRLKLDDNYYYVDPTIAYQRGDIKDLFYPDYQTGLVIAENTTALTPIAFHNTTLVKVKEQFKVTSMFGDGTLKVTSSFRGGEADGARNDFNNESIDELMTSYQKFYAVYYEDIKADSLTYSDDESTGIFTTTEYYTIPNFWKTDKKEVKNFSFESFVINNVIKRPKEKDRKMPFSVLYPASYEEKVVVDLPEKWQVTENELHQKSAVYAFNSKFYCINSHVYLDADYESFKDHATIEEAPAYFKDVNDYDESASFKLTSGGSGSTDLDEKKSNNTNGDIIVIFLIIGIIIGGLVWWSRR